MARRLPVYLVLDTSGSMGGEPIESVRNGLTLLVQALRKEPQALETAYISVITFNSSAQQVVPLTDLFSFQEPTLDASGATALGEALELVANKISSEVVKTTAENKGDWKPLVFIMTDGEPTDEWQRGAESLKKAKPIVVACAAGYNANTELLKNITENVLELKSATSQDIKAFFKWVTDSIKQASIKVNTGANDQGMGQLPPPPPELNIVP